MKKSALLAIITLGGTFAIGCTAEVSECEDTEQVAGAGAEAEPPCDDEGAPEKEGAALSDEEQEFCAGSPC